jgi:hypothetical protein
VLDAAAAAVTRVCQAAGALEKYQVQAVVANLLHTRKDRVLIVQQQGQQEQQQPSVRVDEVLRPPEEPHIEKRLVARVVALHQAFQQHQ